MRVIVIPCYNEANRLLHDPFIEAIEKFDFHLLFVNDGSKDDTLQKLYKLVEERPGKMLVYDMPVNSGKAEAVRAGVARAMAWKEFDLIGYTDADLATPFVEMNRLSKLVSEQRSFVFGSRIVRLGSNIDRKWYRYIFGRVSATFASMTLGLPVYDTQCGAKMFRSELADVLFDKPFLSRWLFDVELFYRMMNKFGREKAIHMFYEVPLDIWIEMGESKLQMSDILKVPLELLRIRKHYRNASS